jgi:hypothetical protein
MQQGPVFGMMLAGAALSPWCWPTWSSGSALEGYTGSAQAERASLLEKVGTVWKAWEVPEMSEYFLAIDQRTTGTMVLIFDRDATIKGRAYSEFTEYYPRPGWVEHDAAEIWKVTKAFIVSAVRNAGI